jgi:signal transduction histidine kinase
LHAIGSDGEIVVTLKNIQITTQHADTHSLTLGKYVYLSIQDNGCGMNETTQQKLFEPFFTTKPPGFGTGMGLSIIQEIMAEANGTIQVQSAANQGSTFSLYFPAHAD